VTKNGGKKSVNRSLCAQSTATPAAQAAKSDAGTGRQADARERPAPAPTPGETKVVKGNRTYVKGPKGGCYYVTSSGRKEYVDRAMCQ
jgi:hypothetical protein